MQVRERHFGRRDQPVVGLLHPEKVVGELRQLPGADHRLGVDHEGGQDLGVGVLARVQVEHEIDEGALEAGARAGVDGEPRPGDLRGPLEVEDPEAGSDLPVRQRLEVELPWLAPAAHLDVVLRGFPPRHALVRDVRDGQEPLLEGRIDRGHLRVELLDPIAEPPHLVDERRGVLLVLLEGGDLLGSLVAPGLQRLDLAQHLAARFVEAVEFVEADLRAAVAERALEEIEMVADPRRVEHGGESNV